MTPDEIPQELIDILDTAAGRTHSRDGSVLRTLAQILTRYDQIRAAAEPDEDSEVVIATFEVQGQKSYTWRRA